MYQARPWPGGQARPNNARRETNDRALGAHELCGVEPAHRRRIC